MRAVKIYSLLVFLSAIVFSGMAGEPFARLQEKARQQYGQAAVARIHFWIKLVTHYRGTDTVEKLHAVNQFFNMQLRFTTDLQTWQQEDYWATPLEALHKGEGDCEDYSLGKYISLLRMGVKEEQLRLIYVQAQIGPDPAKDSQAHMVTAYYPQPGAEPLILDNLVPDIRPASKRPDLTPVFSFNAKDIWVQGQDQSYSNAPSRLSKWQDALNRIYAQGFFDE